MNRRFLFFLLLVVILVVTYVFTRGFDKPNNKYYSSDQASVTPTPLPTVTLIPTPKPTIYIPQPSGYQLRVPILLYHYIGNNPNSADKQRDYLSVTPDKFEEQMKYLSDNGYQTISLDTLYAALKKTVNLPSKPVVLTFDDGYMDFFINAYPILRSYNLSATVFIPTALMDQGYYLTWAQIREMSNSGLIIFGAHSVHHYNLPSLAKSSLDNELSESKSVLQTQLGVPINFMAYPNGTTNNFVISEVKTTGYIGAVGTWPGKIQSEGTIYNMPRLKISGGINISAFAGLL